MRQYHLINSLTLVRAFVRIIPPCEDDLKEEKVEAPNENLLDDNSGLPQGVPFGM